MNNTKQRIAYILFFGILFALAVVIRVQFQVFSAVLLESTLFFRLMLAVSFIAIMRSVVGVNTFGVFGPVIIAFSLLKAGPFWGVALFLDIFILVVAMRFFLDPLKLGASFRVAILVILVSLSITLIELVGEVLHLQSLESALLFPALITAWYADRYTNKVKEIGWKEPNKQLFWTIVVIILSYLLVNINSLVDLFIRNPELWVMLLLLNIYLATKVRFRISEYDRFSTLLAKKILPDDIMGMNVRNREYIETYNPRHFFPAVEKLAMKKTLNGLGLPTPRTLFIASEKKDLKKCERLFSHISSFVIKPNQSLGGEGIIVIVKRTRKGFETVDGQTQSLADLSAHVNQILDGQYSQEDRDQAIIEERVIPDSCFAGKYYRGVPDIRIVVFNGFPIMAMTRLPTKQSEGKANLHKGAIGVGLNIRTGKAISVFSTHKNLKNHPDTNTRVDTIRIPHWRVLLLLAIRAQYASRLGYVGVDIVIDRKRGPLILEVNKRPGIAIQNTNVAGLLKRTRVVEKHLKELELLTPTQKIAQVMAWDQGGWK